MKLYIVAVVSLVFLALDWAALHDILKGEPNISGELATLAVSLIPVALLAVTLLRRRGRGTASSA